MKLFDARMQLGRDYRLEEFQSSDLDSLRRALDKYRIERALVSAFASFRFDIDYGNGLAFEAASRDGRLIPCPSVIPNSWGEVGDEEDYVTDLVARGARAVGLHAKSCGIALDERVLDPLLTVAEARRLPVVIPAGEGAIMEIAPLAAQYPALPMLCAPSYRSRNLLPMLRTAPNVHLMIHAPFVPNEGIEMICRTLGSGRVVFASNYPVSEPGSAVGYLAYSDIAPDEAQSIAFGNMDRLISEVNVE